ncbi:catechol 1,2-dioxygenase [Polynucleobacter sp. MWH-Loch1C5]|uniref:catechol 1,2-dioxygenase n=1 Tax=Polynucleobacter sp. MWH-Loch1C5 TaxID=2689108 RepID=UPI001C0B8540|nr:catechol 1,2-dioxygenase [Polynucleobacter sp. MWH-Loch1C5]MBU3541944.1 catechol 1,2-dioxygenase [Polynucleobacter sp. MWH-Loch1C5]
MKHTEIDALVKSWIVDAADKPANPRVQAIVLRLVADLCKAIEDLDISATEFWKGLEYLQEAGKRHELGLIAPGIGLERFLDMRADEADVKAGLTGGTPRAIEGPLYVAGAPESVGFARLDDGTEVDIAETLFMQGTVYDSKGNSLPNAKVEVWHANTKGSYSYFDQTQSAFNLRRTIVTDSQGRYSFQSIMPNGYGCPPDGSTQALLDLLGRHGNRPAHVHFFVTAPGHRKLTTQINIDGDKYLWDDFAFASREGLVPPVKRINDAAELAKRNLKKPFASIDFDINLVEEKPKAASGLVDRIRAAA